MKKLILCTALIISINSSTFSKTSIWINAKNSFVDLGKAFAENHRRLTAKHKAKVKAFKELEMADVYDELNPEHPDVVKNPVTGKLEIKKKFFISLNEGGSFALTTRIQKQNDRSNFVWQNYFVGAYLTLQTENIKCVNPMLRIAVYYPFYNTFNGMQQFPKQTILYAFDVFTGPTFKTNIKEYIRFTLTPGMHYMYQLTDEYHLNYLGGGISAGIELPVARHWSIMNNGTVSLDYANLGTNKDIQNFDISYQYQASLGVRYSKKGYNRRAYIHKIRKANNESAPETAEEKSENSPEVSEAEKLNM